MNVSVGNEIVPDTSSGTSHTPAFKRPKSPDVLASALTIDVAPANPTGNVFDGIFGTVPSQGTSTSLALSDPEEIVVEQFNFDYTVLDAETRVVVQHRTQQIRVATRRAAKDVVDVGTWLIEAKELLGHGNFRAWLTAEFGWGINTAANFMRVADKCTNFVHLDRFSPSALYVLAAPSTPEDALREAIERADAGEAITHTKAKAIVRTVKRKKNYQTITIEPTPDDAPFTIYNESVSSLDTRIEPASVDAIITDPPYPREYLSVYADLASFAAYALKPGGSLVVMVGQSYLPEILAAMCPIITYHWMAAYLTPGGQAVQLWQRKVNTFWKPLLWFVQGEYTGKWLGDVAKSPPNHNDKRFHDWGQSELGMVDILERFTNPGELVCDPFLGAGTTGLAAIQLGRRFVGADNDNDQVTIAQGRLGALHD